MGATGQLILASVVGYLIGSVSFARIIGSRVAPGADLSRSVVTMGGGGTVEYRGTSATSLRLRGTRVAAGAVGLLDIAKGSAAVVLAARLWPEVPSGEVAGVAVVLGHLYPVWHRFRGGRGLSPLLGSLIAVDWTAVPVVVLGGYGLGVAIGDLFMAYGGGTLLAIPWFVWRHGIGAEFWFAVAANLLFVVSALPEARAWIRYRRTHPQPWRDRVREILGGYPGPERFREPPA